MDSNILYIDDYIRIFLSGNSVMAETYKKGFSVDQTAAILAKHPEILLTDINALRNSIVSAPSRPVKFGELKKRIQLDISPDGFTAEVTFNMSPAELAAAPRDRLINEVTALLQINGVVFGIDLSFMTGELVPGHPYTVARGIPVIDGQDAVIRMYELADARPEVGAGGKVDFYEMKLINRVKPGDWLGERIEATKGTPGKTVRGEEISPQPGKTMPLVYDKNTVAEIPSPHKTTLVSKLVGAVYYTNGMISVSNHLEIDGDAGVATGNIKFDGFVTIKGTVNDGFSVEATKDIEINGPYGLGNVKSLVSTGGSIFIKGGVASRERVEIKAAKNVYVKFADNARIICGETAHIGYYCINSEINAKDVIFDSGNGQVIGGYIKSEIHISVPVCGSELERRTTLEVTGFNRQALVRRLDELFHELSIKKNELQKLKSNGNAGQYDRILILKEEIKMLEDERKQVAAYLKTKGDGEISVTRRIYPNCSIILSGMYAEISADASAHTFYLKDGEIKQI
jgi:uncharacterized protein (DUF342 family)